MRKGKHSTFLTLFCGAIFWTMLWTNPLSAYIFKASLWRRWNASEQYYSYIVVCHDLHNYSEALNKEQIEAFKLVIPTCKNTSLIIENQTTSTQELREFNLCSTGVELRDMCSQRGLPVIEVDYRSKRTRAYYKCLNALAFTDSQQFDKLEKQLIDLGCTTKALSREFEDAFAETYTSLIRLRDHGVLSKQNSEAFLNAIIVIRDQWKDSLDAWKNFDGTLLAYCRQHNCLTSEYLTQSVTFDMSLLDIRMFIRSLETSSLVTIVYAGGIHCTNLERYLYHYSPYALMVFEGTVIDLTQEHVRCPADVAPAHIARFTMTAEKLYTTKGRELAPLNPSFLTSMRDPDSFVRSLPWYRRVMCFLRSTLRDE